MNSTFYLVGFPTCPPPPIPSSPPPGVDAPSYYLTIVQQAGKNLRSVPVEYQTYEIVRLAVEQDGMNLEFASEEWRDHEEIVSVACRQNPESLKYASEKLSRYFKDLYLDR